MDTAVNSFIGFYEDSLVVRQHEDIDWKPN